MTRPALAQADALALNAVLVAARQAIDVVCDRWSLSLVIAAFLGARRFNEYLESTGMANRLLTARLASLRADGLMASAPHAEGSPHQAYRLTGMGEGLFNVLLQMLRWEQAWGPQDRAGSVQALHLSCGSPLRPQLRCAACGVPAGARDIELRLSPAQMQRMPAKQTARRRSTLGSARPDPGVPVLGASLDIFGDKWGIEVLLCAFFRVRRFGDFRLCTGIAANILSDRLSRLIAAGVLRHDAPDYRLTEMGIDLYGVVVAIQDWADLWLADRYRSPLALIHRGCGGVFHPRAVCATCEAPIRHADVGLLDQTPFPAPR